MPKKVVNKEKALAALLNNSSVVAAAKACGLSSETLYGYLRDPQFKTEYREHRREIVEGSIAYAQKLTVEALATLHKLLNSKAEPTQLRAANIILDFAVRGTETTDILERLEALENV